MLIAAFRVLMGAAPLKQDSLGYDPQEADSLPRPYGRGPIEARSVGRRRAIPPAFRVLMGAAPLKRHVNDDAGARIMCLPRPYGRGPIEALNCRLAENELCTFRVLMGAAPLKPLGAGAHVPL